MPPVPHSPAARAEDHARLIVALDAGDLAGAELRTAESLAASCSGCAALVHDLAAIRGAMAALPAPPRLRDYRLTAEDAARLRPSGWRRLLEWLAAPGSTVRPLATSLATLGVVGLLLTSGLLSGFGAGSAAPAMAPEGVTLDNAAPAGSGEVERGGTYAPAAAPSGVPGNDAGLAATAAPAPMPTIVPSSDAAGVAGEAASNGPYSDRTAATPEGAKAAGRDAVPTAPLPVMVSLALLVAGLALIGGRMIARRLLA
jgi:hypothetical protein